MNRYQKGMLALFTCGLVLMLSFPPYFGIDGASQGRIHAFLGYHPFWDPPTREEALAVLSEAGAEPGRSLQLTDLRVDRNNVRLTLNVLGLVLASSIAILALRTRSAGRA
jgi:hypothetical protein